MRKRQYNCIIIYYLNRERNDYDALKFRKVTNVPKLITWALNKGYDVSAVNVYDSFTRKFIKQVRSMEQAHYYFNQ